MENKSNIYIISIIAIVAILGLFTMFMLKGNVAYDNGQQIIIADEEGNLAGEAFKSFNPTIVPVKPVPDKDYVGFNVGYNDLDFTFTNKANNQVGIEFYTDINDSVQWNDCNLNGTLDNLVEDIRFIVNEDTTRLTHIYEVSSIRDADNSNGDFEVELDELTTGERTLYTNGDEIGNSGFFIRISPEANYMDDKFDIYDSSTNGTVKLAQNHVWTKSGMLISFELDKVNFKELNGDTFYANIGYDMEETIIISSPIEWDGTTYIVNDEKRGTDSFGTTFRHDDPDDTFLKLYVPIKNVLISS